MNIGRRLRFYRYKVEALARREEPPPALNVIDIGTEYIKALIVEIREEGAEVIGRGIAHHDVEFKPEGINKPGFLAEACHKALSQARAMAADVKGHPVAPAEALLGLHPILSWGGTDRVNGRRPKPQEPVTRRELESLLYRAERLAFNRFQSASGRSDNPLLDTSLVSVRLDGHKVTDPIGMRGEEIEVVVANWMVHTRTEKALQILAETLAFDVASAMLAPRAFSAYEEGESLLIDLGGRITTLYRMENGTPLKWHFIPLGGWHFTRHLMDAGLSPEKAEALKRSYSLGQLAETTSTAVRESLAPLLTQLLSAIEEGLAELKEGGELPETVKLEGGTALLPGLLEGIREMAARRPDLFPHPPEVRLLEPRLIPGLTDGTGFVPSPMETTAWSLARWAWMERKNPWPLQVLLEKIAWGK